MKELTTLLTPRLARAVALTLLHFLWQGTLIAFLLAAADALLKRSSARLRYAAACAALALMLALPAATLLRLWPRDAASTSSAPTVVAPEIRSTLPGGPAGTEGGQDGIARIAPWIVLGWLTGVAALSIRFLGGFLAAGRLKSRGTSDASAMCQARLARLARALRVSQPVRLLESALVAVPTTIGIPRPVILLPAGIATGLTPGQLDSLLAHELAHIRRRDCLVNILQALAETLLFYHPAVWWVSRRIRIERENACDDLAVAVTGDAAVYARTLVDLAELRAGLGGRSFSGRRLTRRHRRPRENEGSNPSGQGGSIEFAGCHVAVNRKRSPSLLLSRRRQTPSPALPR